MQIQNVNEMVHPLYTEVAPPFITNLIKESWSYIPPYWPLENIIAVNPVSGFEHMDFSDALLKAKHYFQFKDLPHEMECINRISIKWLQAYFDKGQATFQLPDRERGILRCIVPLLIFDNEVCNTKDQEKILTDIGTEPFEIIEYCMNRLHIPVQAQSNFLTLMLTTLPGWASYVQYMISWSYKEDKIVSPVTYESYLAFRILITTLIWENASKILDWHKSLTKEADCGDTYDQIVKQEELYRNSLISSLCKNSNQRKSGDIAPDAQFVFCIDVRSEPFRRLLECTGSYETFGFAGFFGLPITIKNAARKIVHSSCPVLLSSSYVVEEQPKRTERLSSYTLLQQLYQSLKYNITTPFSLVEFFGVIGGLALLRNTILLKLRKIFNFKNSPSLTSEHFDVVTSINIPIKEQVGLAKEFLTVTGLKNKLAEIVIFCGHGSTTVNNAFSSGLDCGACGGHHGASNAKVMASILNSDLVRLELKKININIPEATYFLAALHNTTTDELHLFDDAAPDHVKRKTAEIKNDLIKVTTQNKAVRSLTFETNGSCCSKKVDVSLNSMDWSAVRPEWGLARNASFIISPRSYIKGVNLEGRSFLHSYDYTQDSEGAQLKAILTAPVIVAQWINAQYLFSALDNISFGAGSKITKNITGKLGVMQGNASDLMTGLALQSVKNNDIESYHEPLRLSVFVSAPRELISKIVSEEKNLRQLVQNRWIHLSSLDFDSGTCFSLNEKLEWVQHHVH